MPTSIEVRSIDYVPDGERHGGLASQFTLWLAANLQITAIVTGALAVVFGGDVFWSLVALLFGQLIGGAVMALHAAQGPQLGLPQMISCRVQFGIYGAVIPIVAVCLMYIGFSASGCVLAGQAVGQLLHVDDGFGIVVFSAFIVIVTLFGYRFIHLLGRIASVVGMAAFVYMFSRLFASHDIVALLAERHFSFSEFSSVDVLVGVMADRLRAIRCRLFALPAARHLDSAGVRRRGTRVSHRFADIHDFRGSRCGARRKAVRASRGGLYRESRDRPARSRACCTSASHSARSR